MPRPKMWCGERLAALRKRAEVDRVPRGTLAEEFGVSLQALIAVCHREGVLLPHSGVPPGPRRKK